MRKWIVAAVLAASMIGTAAVQAAECCKTGDAPCCPSGPCCPKK